MNEIICRTITVKGTVQGVGYRPFVYRLAVESGIKGDVINSDLGVVIRVMGNSESLDRFVAALTRQSPPLAGVRSVDVRDSPLDFLPRAFTIAHSSSGQPLEIDIARDTAVCPSCLAEMLDPSNRRYLHPFINCTDCGPRYTIISGLPYDRPKTTMSAFEMCDDCRREYEDPANRRFHAQPVCCNTCGPKLKLTDASGNILAATPPLDGAVGMLAEGKILAIKSLGGYHLACRADSSEAVARLRMRKRREEKPFAIMVKNSSAAQRYATIDASELTLLESPERPIVLLSALVGLTEIAPEVAPGLPTLGIMLPYTPVHHMLFLDQRLDAVVMTSANITDQPIIYDDSTAFETLGPVVDGFLTHDRAIHMRNDDSIVRVVAGKPMLLRRSRGYVPEPLPALHNVNGLVALGGVLKSTVAVGRYTDCYLSHFIGSVETTQTLDAMALAASHLSKTLGVATQAYVCDMHPNSFVSAYAHATGLPVVKVQHHHAHASACMAENEITAGALSIVYDGTGYGDDGNIWGGEILHTTFTGYNRLGHLSYLRLPGGDEAIRNPGRIALAALHSLLGKKAAEALPWMPDDEKSAVLDMVQADTSCPLSSGMGRLFDAASALLGICTRRTYEGQPAIMLEGAADVLETGAYGSPLSIDENGISIDGAALLCEVYDDIKAGTPVPRISARFHTTIAQATAAAATIAAQQCECTNVCLTGGVFQNALLVSRLLPLLMQAGLLPILHRRTPPNDESISYGQLVVAGARRILQK